MVPRDRRKEQPKFLITESHSGPLPAPAVLEAYERLCPGAAAKIMGWASDSLEHERKIESRALELFARDMRTGQIFALVIGLAAFVTSIICIFLGHPIVATIIAATVVVPLVLAFLRRDVPPPASESDESAKSGDKTG